ncbi:hypothetical protein FRC12_005354 [Ceratobasidium sp. 428]|nr:hypothetical protein FRC12_005354 [Ceratobasidium sp. 428]
MTLSSLFRSLDDLDAVSSDDSDSAPSAGFSNDPHPHDQRSLKRPAATPYPEAKRARTLQTGRALPTRPPRFGGTGAPPSETIPSAPAPSSPDNELAPVVIQLASSRPASEHIRSVRPAQQSPAGDAEPPSSEIRSSSPSNLCSSRVPASGKLEDGSRIQPGSTPPRVHQMTSKTVPQNLIDAATLGGTGVDRDRVSVPDTALIATRSKSPVATATKLVSQSRVRPPATTARAKSKSSTIITSNSFQRGSTAPDNHVAGPSSVNLSTVTPQFGEHITLVSRKSRHPSKLGKSGGVKDIRDQCATISEFALYLQTQSRDAESKGSRQKSIFRDLIVYYAGNDPGKRITHSTKRRMEILSERGTKVVGTFDSSITHIVSDLPEKPLLVALGLQSVNSIPPSIWVVGWTWVTKSMNSMRRLEETPYERFHKRLVLDSRPSRVYKHRHRSMSVGTNECTETGASSEDSSREGSEAGGEEYPLSTRSGLSITHGSATHVEVIPDPLEEVVALARNMTHEDYSSERSSSPEVPHLMDTRASEIPKAQSKSFSYPHGNGFACLSPNTTPAGSCVNQALIDELTRLRDIYEAKKHEDPSNQFRVMNYNKAIRSIASHPTKITCVDQAASLAGVGTSISEKIGEFIATGCVAKIAAQTTEDIAVVRLFQGIYGVGPQTAHNWYVRGLRTLADVRNRVGGIVLSKAQELGLEYYADLQRRMLRDEASTIFGRIKAVALELDPELDIEIMGSFRRGKATCGDIDILITRSTTDGRSHRGLLHRLVPLLRSKHLVTHDLAFPSDENELEAKYMGLCQLHSDTLMRRIDILTVPREQWGASLLYFVRPVSSYHASPLTHHLLNLTRADVTLDGRRFGMVFVRSTAVENYPPTDIQFNRSMRLLARKKGMSLNQRGLFKGVIRDPKTQKKHNEGVVVASRTEREIFDYLGVVGNRSSVTLLSLDNLLLFLNHYL